MPLQVLPTQLRLFDTLPLLSEIAVDGRTGDQWLRSVLKYLEWRSGDCWRRLSVKSQRESPERWEYLSALRLVESLRYAPTESPKRLPQIVAKPSRVEARSRTLSHKPRKWLVDELMAVDQRLTNRKILLRLSRPKLARMLVAALDSKRATIQAELEMTA